jgi:N-acetylglucosamine kinase-like BadF-type ATPase
MATHWIGLDAGGTGSTLVVTDNDLKAILTLSGGAIQARKMTLDDQIAVIQGFLTSVDNEIGLTSICGMGLGIAGTGRPDERLAIEHVLLKLYPTIPCRVAPDSEAAHIGAFSNGSGILVITGTGSIVWGRHKNTWMRAGGFGYLIGDEGSGMKLGMEGLSAAGLAWDGGHQTMLCELLSREHGITDGASMVKAVYDGGLQPSKIATEVLESANLGDEICIMICERQAHLLALQIGIVATKIPAEYRNIVLWGGLQRNTYYKSLLQNKIVNCIPSVQFLEPEHKPWIGAALMAKNSTQHVGSSGSL